MSGFINNIHALRWLWNILENDFEFEQLCTNHLTQDPQENNFSEIRRRCGSNDTPTAYQFGAAYKYAAIAENAKLAEGTNCEDDSALSLLDDKDLSNNATYTESTRYTYKCLPLALLRRDECNSAELNALMYIVGASASKLRHERCRKRLLLNRDNVTRSQNTAYSFCLLKNAHCYPGTTLFEIGFLAFSAYKQRFLKYLHQNRKFVKARLRDHVSHTDFEGYVCSACFDTIIDKIFNTLISGYLKKLRVQRKVSTKKIGFGKRNSKARKMNLPAA